METLEPNLKPNTKPEAESATSAKLQDFTPPGMYESKKINWEGLHDYTNITRLLEMEIKEQVQQNSTDEDKIMENLKNILPLPKVEEFLQDRKQIGYNSLVESLETDLKTKPKEIKEMNALIEEINKTKDLTTLEMSLRKLKSYF